MVHRIVALASLLVLVGACGGGSTKSNEVTWTVASSRAQVTADGVATTSLTATAARDDGSAVVGQGVSFEVSGTGNVLSAGDATTGGDGVASVTLKSTVVETKTVTVRSGGAVVGTAKVTFTPGAPSLGLSGKSRLQVSATSLAVGDTVTVTATIKDALEHPISGTAVTFSASAGHLSATSAATSDTGVASVTLDAGEALDAVVAATVGGTDVYGSITVVFLGPAASLSLAAQPDAGSAGVPLADLVITALDSALHPVAFPGDVSLSLATAPSGSLLHGTTSRTPAGPVVTFIDLILEKAGTYEIKVKSGTLEVIGAPFIVSPGSADPAHGVVTLSAATATVDVPTTITVTARDSFDNAVSGETVTLSATGAGNTLTQPSAVTDAAGIATGSIASTAAGAKVVSAALGSGAVSSTATLTVLAGPAASIAFVGAPASGTAGAALGAVTVGAFDSHQNATTFPGTVSVSLATSPAGATLDGTKSQTPVAATVSFADLKVYKVGGYVLEATSGTFTAASPAITIGPAAEAQLVFATQPASSVIAGTPIAASVAVVDAYGNAVPTATPSVTMGLGGNAAALTLHGTKTQAAATGVAQFGDLWVGEAGTGYQLVASSTGLTSAASSTFAIVAGAADVSLSDVAPTSAHMAQADGTSSIGLTITVRDAYGNPVAGEVITLTANGTGNTITQPTTPTDAAGQTTAAIVSTKAEVKIVTAHLGSAALGGTASVTFLGGPVAAIVIAAAPSSGIAGVALTDLTISAQDSTGNPAAFPGDVAVALLTSPAGAALTGIASRTPVDASITFPGLSVQKAGSYVLRVTSGTLRVDTSSFDVTAANPDLAHSGIAASVGSAAVDVLVTLTATVRDTWDNPVQGVAVTFASTGTGNTISNPIGLTNASGVATGSIRSTKAEAKTVNGNVTGLGAMTLATASVTITAGAADAARSFVVVASPSATVGTTVGITATVRDQYDNLVEGEAVTFGATGTSNTVAVVSGTTDAAGHATGTITSTKAEAKTVTAYLGGPTAMGTTAAVTFTADVADPAKCSVAAASSTAIAGGSVGLTATVLDQYYNPVAGVSVTFGASGSNNTVTIVSGTSDADGHATATLASTTAEVKTVTGYVGGTDPMGITDLVTFGPDVPNAARSGVTAAAGDVAAGASKSVTATVRDQYDNVVSGVVVTFQASGTVNGFTPASDTTNASGQVTTSFSSTKAEAKVVTGYLGTTAMTFSTASFSVIAAAADPAHSGVSAATGDLTAGGSKTITATVRDQYDNLASGVVVTFGASGTDNTFTPTSATTDASGQASTTFSSTKAEGKVVTGYLSGVAMTLATVSFSFTPGTPDAAHSGVTATTTDVAAGVGKTVVATVRDQYDNPVPSVAITLESSGTVNTLTPAGGNTDTLGQLTSSFSSTKAEAKVVTGYIGTAAMTLSTASFNVVADAADPAHSGVTAASGDLTAGASKSVTATVRDQYDNLVSGAVVTFGASGTNNTFNPAGGTTDTSGQVSTTYSSTKAEAKIVTGYLPSTTPMTLSTVSFSYTPDVPSAAHSGVTAAAGNVTAGGSKTITATVRDQYDNPIQNVAITFGSSGTVNTLTPTGGNTDAAGQLTTVFSSTKAEAKVVTGYLTGPEAMTQSTVSFSFTPDAPDAAHCGVAAATGDVTAGSSKTVTATVRDQYDNPIQNVAITFGSDGTSNTFTPTGGNTDTAGQLSTSFSSTKAETKIVTGYLASGPTAMTQATATVKFVAGVADAAKSGVSAPAGTVVVDSTKTITALVEDQYYNPVAGEAVTFSATGSNNTFNPTTAVTTDANGEATATLTSTTAEVKTVTGYLGAVPMTNATADVEFVAGDPVVANSTIATTPVSASVPDDGTSMALTITLKDTHSNVCPGKTVTLATDGVGTTVDPTLPTDASGVTAGSVSSLVVGNPTISAMIGATVVATKVVTFTEAPPHAGNSTITVPLVAAAGDGLTAAPVTVTVRDTINRPMSGKSVQLTCTGTGTVVASPQATNASGVASFGVIASAAGTCTVGAVVEPAGVNVTVTATPSFNFYVCTGTLEFCNAVCVDKQTDNANCGTCNNVCAAGHKVCSTGACVTQVCAMNKLTLPETTQILQTPTGPRAVAVADLNKDGKPDLIVGNYDDNSVSVFLGVGDGAYAAPSRVALGGAVRSLAVGDVNTDGNLDVLVGYASGTTVTILRGAGDGTFSSSTNHTVVGDSYMVALAKVDAGNTLDIINVGYYGTVTVLPGDGSGGFGAAKTITTISGGRDIAVADVNHDGAVDVVVALNLSAQINVLLGNGDGTFKTPSQYTTATGPYGITVADFNGDGNLDVATANSLASGTVSVLLGDGVGAFGTHVEYAVGDTPAGIAAGDVDGDNKVDLLVANYDRSLSLLHGLGTGVFKGDTRFTIGKQAYQVVATDLTGDGKLDVVTANYFSGDLSVLVGNGSGAFRGQAKFGAGSTVNSITAEDLDGDGAKDIVVTNRDSKLTSILLGNKNGTLQWRQQLTVGTSPVAVAVADMNHDNRKDLIVLNDSTDLTVGVLLQNSDGSFAAMTTTKIPSVSPGIAVVDLNHDTYPDVVVPGAGSHVTVLLNDGSGILTQPTDSPHTVANMPMGVAVADLDGDGNVDIVTANQNGDDVAVMYGVGDGKFGAASYISVGGVGLQPTRVAIGFIDADANADIVAMNQGGGSVSVILGAGLRTFDPAVEYPVGTTPLALALADIDGDGRPDVLTGDTAENSLTIRHGNADGTLGAPTTLLVGDTPTGIAVVDLDGDTRQDVVVSVENEGVVAVFMGSATGLVGVPATSVGTSPRGLALGSFNGDSYLDAAVASSGTNKAGVLLGQSGARFGVPTYYGVGTSPNGVATGLLDSGTVLDLVTVDGGGVSVLFGSGTGTFGSAATYAAGSGPYGVAVGAIDNVAGQDIAVTNATAGTVTVLVNDGSGAFAGTDLTAGTAPHGVAIADLNGDNYGDIIVANSGSANVGVFLNSAGGFTSPQVTYTVGTTPEAVAVGYFNADAYPDVVVTNSASGTVTVLFGDGTGALGSPATIAVGTNPMFVAIADVNFDGNADIITANGTGRSVTVLQGRGDGAFDPLSFALSAQPLGMATGDVDLDGRQDIVISSAQGVFPLISTCQ